MTNIPDGFRPGDLGAGFVGHIGPFYERLLPDDGGAHLGIAVERRHINPAGMVHGGLLATLMDVGIAYHASLAVGKGTFYVTMGLNLNFLAAAGLGDWIETRATISRHGRNTLFGTGEIRSGETLLMTGSGIYIPWRGTAQPRSGYADFDTSDRSGA